jgi:hypothetical protein
MFLRRDEAEIARIQFALAGMNAHINHDLPLAIVATCRHRNTVPQHGTPQYNDYTALNTTLDGLIDTAKKTLNVSPCTQSSTVGILPITCRGLVRPP